MKVESVYHPAVACLGPDASLSEAASLMRAGEFGSMAIYEGDRLAGILTETDLVRAVADHRDLASTTVSEYMSLDPVTAGLDEDSMEVAERMVRNGFRHLPVVEKGRLIGMVSARDLLQVEAWPPARHRATTGVASIEHPVRPRRRPRLQA
jgi:Predicted signal-transduction protein containing cAMP-binding and CBS domains